MQYYFKPVRELPTGRGFADFVYIPKPEYKADYPALVVELKWNRTADTALQQIKDRKYPQSLEPTISVKLRLFAGLKQILHADPSSFR